MRVVLSRDWWKITITALNSRLLVPPVHNALFIQVRFNKAMESALVLISLIVSGLSLCLLQLVMEYCLGSASDLLEGKFDGSR